MPDPLLKSDTSQRASDLRYWRPVGAFDRPAAAPHLLFSARVAEPACGAHSIGAVRAPCGAPADQRRRCTDCEHWRLRLERRLRAVSRIRNRPTRPIAFTEPPARLLLCRPASLPTSAIWPACIHPAGDAREAPRPSPRLIDRGRAHDSERFSASASKRAGAWSNP
jgi:hypothetical protein